MTPAEAKQIIEVLAGGIDPATGEVLPDDSPLSNPMSSVRCSSRPRRWNRRRPSPPGLRPPRRATPASPGPKKKTNAWLPASTPVRPWPRWRAPTSAPRVPSTRAWSSWAGCRPATRARLPERLGLTAAGLPCGASRSLVFHRIAPAYGVRARQGQAAFAARPKPRP